MTVRARNDLFPVYQLANDEDGYRWLTLDLPGPEYEYDQVKELPRVLEHENVIFVRTGWNSDTGKVYYRDRMPVAKKV